MKHTRILAAAALLAVTSAGTIAATSQAIPANAEGETSSIAEPASSSVAESVSSEPQASSASKPAEVSDWEKFVDKYLSGEKVAMYLSWVAYIGTIIGLVANLKRLKESNNLTLKNVSEEVKKLLTETIGEEIGRKFGEIIPKVLTVQEKTNEIMTIFAKILALSQENSPESRVAILDLIQELGTVGKDTIDNAKEAIEDSVRTAQEAKEELDKKIDEIIESYDGTSI